MQMDLKAMVLLPQSVVCVPVTGKVREAAKGRKREEMV